MENTVMTFEKMMMVSIEYVLYFVYNWQETIYILFRNLSKWRISYYSNLSQLCETGGDDRVQDNISKLVVVVV
jgi:hypothetical protein